MSNNGSTTPDLNVTFYDNFVPSLKAAQYTVTVSQSLTVDATQTAQDGGSADVPAHPQPDATQTFIVRAPRFVIDPADVHRAFPPPNGVGKYDEYLPMIVLNKRALPWEREMDLNVTDAPSYPWMALLLFSDDELLMPQPASTSAAAPPPSGSQQNPTRAASFPLNDVVVSTSNIKTTGPPQGILGPTLGLEDDEDPQKIFCTVIDISADTFTQLLPSGNDLRFLAHVRQVSTENKEPLNMTHDGWFSVVLSNRFSIPPVDSTSTTGQRNIVHLVSLEGFESYLGTDAPLKPTGCQKVRLISLYSWVFNCLPDPQENFRELMLNLISDDSQQGTDLLLRLPLPAVLSAESVAETTALTRLQNGYIPLSYMTQTGEQTFAWYRSPLAPVVSAEFLEATSPDAADNLEAPETTSEAMIFDPATGLFDQSYAVAFQTGRSLGLASLPFATDLLQWRRDAHGLIDLLMEYIRSPHLYGILQNEGIVDAQGNLTGVDAADLAKLLDANLVSNAFKDFLATEFSDQIAGLIGRTGGFTQQDKEQQPTNPSTTQPVVPSDLSNLMQDPAVVALIQQMSGLEESVNGAQQFEASILPDQVIEWLAKKALLYDVPFNNLVPDARMLPVESVRFFYIDQNWIDSLIDGALSVGIQSSRDQLFHQLMRDALHRAVDAVLQEVRARLRGVNSIGTPPPLGTMAGFVLRSAVVSGWPGLEVRAWSAADDTNPMKPLRLDRVSPTVMIGIYPDVPVKLEFNEPSEGLVFGFEDEGFAIRYLPGTAGATASNIGHVVNPQEPTYLTPSEINQLKRALPSMQPPLDIGSLATALQNKFSAPQPTLGPASFAVEIVRVPEQMLFAPENGANR